MKSGNSGAISCAVEDMAKERGGLNDAERQGAARASFDAGHASVLTDRSTALQETGRAAVTRDKVPTKAEDPVARGGTEERARAASPDEKKIMRAAGAAGDLRRTGARVPARIL